MLQVIPITGIPEIKAGTAPSRAIATALEPTQSRSPMVGISASPLAGPASPAISPRAVPDVRGSFVPASPAISTPRRTRC